MILNAKTADNSPVRRGAAARVRLEKAALQCFVRRGIDASTTKEIAKAARMAEGNLYRHFASKEDLAWALYEDRLAAFVVLLEEAGRGAGGARERLNALLGRFRRLLEEDPDTYAYIVQAQHSLLKRTPKGMRNPTDVVAEVLAEGQKAGEVRAGSPTLLATLLVGMVIRTTLLRMTGWLSESPKALERELAEACWRVVRV